MCIAQPKLKIEQLDAQDQSLGELTQHQVAAGSTFDDCFFRVTNVGLAPLNLLSLVCNGQVLITGELSATTLGPRQTALFSAKKSIGGNAVVTLSSNDPGLPEFYISLP
jgi:hypothetical protein